MVGCSSKRAAWCPDPTGQVSCSRLGIYFPLLYKNGLLEWRWHVGLWTLRYRTTSGLSLLTSPWAWTSCKGPCTSCCPLMFHQSASWNLPYPREEWGKAADNLCPMNPWCWHQGHSMLSTGSTPFVKLSSLGVWSCLLPGLLRWLLHKDNGLFQPMSLLAFSWCGDIWLSPGPLQL